MIEHRRARWLAPLFTCLISLTPAVNAAQHAASELEEMDALLEEKMQEADAEEQKLLEQMDDDNAGTASGQQNPGQGAGNANASSGQAGETPTEVGATQKAEQEQAEGQIPELPRISPDIGGVLTPRNRLVVEPSFRFQQTSVNSIAIEGLTIIPALLVGRIDIAEVDRESFTAQLTARYGVTNRIEAEITAPYLWRNDSTRTRSFNVGTSDETLFSSSGNGIGDIEGGLRYQFNRGQNGWPFLVGNLRVKSDTGTDPFELSLRAQQEDNVDVASELATGSGFWSVNPSVTFIMPSDPVVFFGNLGYLYTFEDDKGTFTIVDNLGNETVLGFGDVDPGDALRFNFGMGIGLNESSSWSISYSLDSFSETSIEQSGGKLAGSDVTIGKLLFGFSLRLQNGIPLNLAIGIGVTDDAPDTDITFRVPFNILN